MDKERKNLEFEVRDFVVVGISSVKGGIRLGKTVRLAPEYIGSFCILVRISVLDYRSELPVGELGFVVFHISLREYV